MKLFDIHAEEFDACQKCALCESFCPVLQVEPSFAGPKLAGADRVRLAYLNKAFLVEKTIDYCTDCRACNMVCPHGIKPANLIMKQRWEVKKQQRLSLRDRILSRPDKIGTMFSLCAPLINRIMKQKAIRKVAEKTIGIAATKSFPEYKRISFSRMFTSARKSRNRKSFREIKVIYFYGCYVNFNRPDLDMRLVELLESNGIEVLLTPQLCCGLPLIHNGDVEKARNLARQNLQYLLPYIEKGIPLIFTCPSCACMFKSYYPEVYRLSGAAEVAKLSFDAIEFILNKVPDLLIYKSLVSKPQRIVYHVPCHLRVQGIGTPAAELLSLIPDLQLAVFNSHCCGMAGTYGFKVEKYHLSVKIGEGLFKDIRSFNPDRVVTECGMCAIQIKEGTGCTVVHPIDLLLEASTISRKEVN
jgi:glycerol-3-phosphate dehydrogenase subunit C